MSGKAANRLLFWPLVCCAGSAVLVVGCTSPRDTAPKIDPAEAARQALADYDLNKDGFLDSQELTRCAALRSSLKQIDTNGDGRLSAKEITERLHSYPMDATGRFSFPCHVTLDARPLAGAAVTFVPEKFLGPTYPRASGVTDEDGAVEVQEEGKAVAGIYSGFYRIEVSRKDAQGQETIPARYNSQTILGQEAAPDTLGRGGDVSINLTSR